MDSNTRRESKKYYLRTWGDLALFTRPEFRNERLSHAYPPHSCPNGILRYLMGKHAINWQVHRCFILSPVRFTQMFRNELKSFSGKSPIQIEDRRTQRYSTLLRDVNYVFEASMYLVPENMHDDDNIEKFERMFEREARRGGYYDRPFFGIREYSANFELLDGLHSVPKPQPINEDVGMMYYDINYGQGEGTPYMFYAKVKDGILEYPSWSEVKAYGKTLGDARPYDVRPDRKGNAA